MVCVQDDVLGFFVFVCLCGRNVCFYSLYNQHLLKIIIDLFFLFFFFRNVDVAVWGYEGSLPFDAQATVMQQHGLSFTLVPVI